MHSDAGVSTVDAVQGLLATDLAKVGKMGGVVGLIYLTAFLLPIGVSLLATLGGVPLRWFNITSGYIYPSTLQNIFSDLPKLEADFWSSFIQSQSYATFPVQSITTPITCPVLLPFL